MNHSEELLRLVRRNKLLGMWAAQKLDTSKNRLWGAGWEADVGRGARIVRLCDGQLGGVCPHRPRHASQYHAATGRLPSQTMRRML